MARLDFMQHPDHNLKASYFHSNTHFHRTSYSSTSQTCPKPARRFSLIGMAVIVLGLELMAGTERAMAQRATGIDVSDLQGSVNWASVESSGVSFAWAKATEGTFSIDPDFTSNEANAKSAGLLIGAYAFARYDLDPGTAGATSEANYFWGTAKNYVKGNGSYLMPMLDVEQAPGSGYTQNTLSQWVNQWCLTVANDAAAIGLTVKPIIYTYPSFATTWLNTSVTQYPLWMGNPNGQNSQNGTPGATGPWSTWSLWQYGSASVPGISGPVDEDVFNGPSATLPSTLEVVSAPEPATWSMLSLGLVACGLGRRYAGRRK